MLVLCARVQQLLRGAFVPSDFCAAIQGISLFRVPLLGTVDCTRVFPGRISGGLLVALRRFICLRPRFSCGTCCAKCSCFPDFSSTFLQVPLTNWWHDFYLPTTYCVMSTSQELHLFVVTLLVPLKKYIRVVRAELSIELVVALWARARSK